MANFSISKYNSDAKLHCKVKVLRREGTHKSSVSKTIDTISEGTSSLILRYDSNPVVHASKSQIWINVDIRDNRTQQKDCVPISYVNISELHTLMNQVPFGHVHTSDSKASPIEQS